MVYVRKQSFVKIAKLSTVTDTRQNWDQVIEFSHDV